MGKSRKLLLLALILASCATPSAPLSSATATQEGNAQATELPTQIVTPMTAEQALALKDLGWITFTASDGGRRDVWLIRPDGTNEINLTTNLPNVFAEAPVWAPDGATIAFDGVLNSDVLRDIFLVTVNDHPVQTQLTTLPGFDCYPSFSPDGQQIVYMSERDKNRDLYIIDLQGNEVARLTTDPTYDYEPAWSPDGKQIAYVSRKTGDSEIYLMNVDGSNVRQLTDVHGLDWRPTWSPDGKWIVFESWRNGNADVYMMAADGSHEQQLTDNPAEDGNPTFSPDGRYIVFHSRRSGDYQLFIMEVAHPENQWHLPTKSPRALLPVWSPVNTLPNELPQPGS
jgi:TolB protein